MTKYSKHLSPETKTVRTKGQFIINPFEALTRWLILGQEGSTYYATEKAVVKANAELIKQCLDQDFKRTVDLIVNVSESARAPKNDPAIMALAIACSHGKPERTKYALDNLNKVCRTATHLFQFVSTVKTLRGFGRGLRKGINRWYLEKKPDQLAYQLVKYRNREGFRHRDVLRLTHPTVQDISALHTDTKEADAIQATLRWAVDDTNLGRRTVQRGKGKNSPVVVYDKVSSLPKIIKSFQAVQEPGLTNTQVLNIMRESKLTHEMLPNNVKDDPEIWRYMLPTMGMTAMVRNLAKMSSIGLFNGITPETKLVVERLGNLEEMRKAKMHPMDFLKAMLTYQQGHGTKGSLRWTVNQNIKAALESAFYLAFQAVEPSNKNVLQAIDVSGSMHSGIVGGCPGLTPAMATAVMSMVTVRNEPWVETYAFGSHFEPFPLTKTTSLDEILKKTYCMNFGSTNCGLPMNYATRHKLPVDVFIIHTDNEHNAGGCAAPSVELEKYRQASGRDAKMIAVAYTATSYSVSDPSDINSLNIVGMDSATPLIISEFAKM